MSASPTESPADIRDTKGDVTPVARSSSPAPSDEDDSGRSEKAVLPDAKEELEPALPSEEPPPLPTEAPPGHAEDDGWDPVWDQNAQAFYFYNRFTNTSQWENPRVPANIEPAPPGVGNHDRIAPTPKTDPPPASTTRAAGGYDPAIHGDYDPSADYAKVHQDSTTGDPAELAALDVADPYAATGSFNRFTGKWQVTTLNPENFNDENKSRRQMNAYFDVDAAANSHDGKSLKAERSGKKLSKKELQAFKDKRRERKEEKRRAWLRD